MKDNIFTLFEMGINGPNSKYVRKRQVTTWDLWVKYSKIERGREQEYRKQRQINGFFSPSFYNSS